MTPDPTPSASAGGVESSPDPEGLPARDPGSDADLLARAAAAALGGVPTGAEAPISVLLRRGVGPATFARAQWLLAVARGASGRYGEAFTQLEALLGDDDGPVVVRAAASSTTASLLRQIGDHPAAEPHDARAAALLAGLPLAVAVDERLDAAVGLTADAVGLGRLDVARERLAAAHRLAGLDAAVPPSWRPLVRLHWAEAEVALLAGQGEPAEAAAEQAVALTVAAGAVRHQVKSAMFLGVAQGIDGRTDAAAATLLEAASLADAAGLLPLVWPIRAVLATMPQASAGDADQHLDRARAATRVIAAGLPHERVARWTSRDPMAAFLLGPDFRAGRLP